MENAKKVLLVEDEDYIRELYKRQLDLSGFTTDAFGLGKDGLAAASQNQYDLVLLDIMLPDINGLQILQQLKQSDKSKSTPVVLLTNLGQDAVIKQGFELGADGYLVKAAYTPDQIVQEVKNIMARKQSTPIATTVPAPATPAPLSQQAAPSDTTLIQDPALSIPEVTSDSSETNNSGGQGGQNT
jgi:two-component system, OmpR family, response regulator ResD